MPTIEKAAKDRKGKKVATMLKNADDPHLRSMRRKRNRKRKIDKLKRRTERTLNVMRDPRRV